MNKKTGGGGDRNKVPARNQADTGGYRTQDERPDYEEREAPEEGASRNQADTGDEKTRAEKTP